MIISIIGATAGSKQSGQDIKELWIDDLGKEQRMRELDGLVKKNQHLIKYFKNGKQ